ncbi:MAG: GNAT family N-acetyltransferase [Pseudomonadota bacterium]
MTEVTFRPADDADIERLLPLIHSAYRGDSARLGWTHEADLLDGQRTDVDALHAILADPAEAIIIAERGGILIGCVRVTDLGDGLSSLGMLAVDPVRQGGGLGRRLIAEAEAHARRLAQRRMEMTVISQRAELIAFYERRGYELTGETRPFPATDPRFGVPRRSDLAFIVMERALT